MEKCALRLAPFDRKGQAGGSPHWEKQGGNAFLMPHQVPKNSHFSIVDLLNQFEQVIVDLPASGHALGILRVPETAQSLMKAGPVYDKATQILSVFNPSTPPGCCGFPEHMVVNESLEFTECDGFKHQSSQNGLNRMTFLTGWLSAWTLEPKLGQISPWACGSWAVGSRIEAGTQTTIDRLEAGLNLFFLFPDLVPWWIWWRCWACGWADVSHLKRQQMGGSNDESLLSNRLLICVGAGGVGKTSMAATIGLRAAIRQKSWYWPLIPQNWPISGTQCLWKCETRLTFWFRCQGELWAMMLDGKQAFYDLIERIAQNEAHRDSIFGNNIFKSIADTIVGNQSHGHWHAVWCNDFWPLWLVIGYTPVKNFLIFLIRRSMAALLTRESWMVLEPVEHGFLNQLVNTASSAVFKLLSHVFGEHFLNDIVVFFHNFRELYEGFQNAIKPLKQCLERWYSVLLWLHPINQPFGCRFLSGWAQKEFSVPAVIINQRHQTGTIHRCSTSHSKCGAHRRFWLSLSDLWPPVWGLHIDGFNGWTGWKSVVDSTTQAETPTVYSVPRCMEKSMICLHSTVWVLLFNPSDTIRMMIWLLCFVFSVFGTFGHGSSE